MHETSQKKFVLILSILRIRTIFFVLYESLVVVAFVIVSSKYNNFMLTLQVDMLTSNKNEKYHKYSSCRGLKNSIS